MTRINVIINEKKTFVILNEKIIYSCEMTKNEKLNNSIIEKARILAYLESININEVIIKELRY